MARIVVRAVVVTAYEPAAGPAPGEFRYWRERMGFDQTLPFAYGLGPLSLGPDGVLGIVTGVGAVRAAAAIMALGLDTRFDLTQACFLISGVCGIDPARGSLGSVVLPQYVVDGDFAHEIDAREIPPEWPDGFIPIGKSKPYELPRQDRFEGEDGLVFRLNARLVQSAFDAAQNTLLQDSDKMAARRIQFAPASAQAPPAVLRGDELSSTTFWHGKLLNSRAQAWVQYQTEGRGAYTITAMEDSGTLRSLQLLEKAGRVDFNRVLIVRAASNFDQQRVGLSAAESLAETKIVSYSAYLPALENAWRVGRTVLNAMR